MSAASQTAPTSSFSAKRVNGSTFVIREDDTFEEHPLIFVKIHPRSPLIVLSDTGCDEPSEKHAKDDYIHLRKFLENCQLECNDGKPLNPGGTRHYMVICTHCHFDHMLGITQFLEGGTTQIVASAAGRDFVESDLEGHGLFKDIGLPAPYYQVTKWADAFERLHQPSQLSGSPHSRQEVDLGITIIQTPGHTPDELAWYDHDEMHLYVGDSFYEEGEDNMPIVWPVHGNMIEWTFSMQKLLYFVKSENARAAVNASSGDEKTWVKVPKRVLVSCGHQTVAVDGEEILEALETFWWRVVAGEVPVVKSFCADGVWRDAWRDKGDDRTKMTLMGPRFLMGDARTFFNGTGKY